VRFQFAPLTLPQVQPGGSTFSLRLVAPGGGSDVPADFAGVEVRHEWELAKEELPQP
jgi:hypothetical protein